MNQFSHRVGKHVICALPLVFSAFFLSPVAFAGGFDTPSYDANFPESLMGTKSKDEALNQMEQGNLAVEEKKPTVTVLPTTFDFTDWQETQQNNSINCKSDGFNTVCLDSKQAESLAW